MQPQNNVITFKNRLFDIYAVILRAFLLMLRGATFCLRAREWFLKILGNRYSNNILHPDSHLIQKTI